MTALEQLNAVAESIAQICDRYHVAELAVFGSAATGAARPDSDIDLLVTFREDARVGLLTFNRLKRELETTVGRRVDLVPKDGLKELIRDEVLGEARVLYAVYDVPTLRTQILSILHEEFPETGPS